ncbi:MAG: hypothetical protein ACJ763_12810 [Bdellovibrionia bacterium]
MKKFGMMLMSAALMLSSMSAMAMRIDFNGGEYRLPECGGTIEAKGGELEAFLSGSQANQMNLIIRGSRECSNFIIENTDHEYKLEEGRNGRGGSYSITADKLHMGWNQVNLTVRSNSGKHSDDVSIWVNVVRGHDSNSGGARRCSDEAESAARDRYLDQYGSRAKSADADFDRVSNSGNYVYDVSVRGRAGSVHYETVMRPDCSLASKPSSH